MKLSEAEIIANLKTVVAPSDAHREVEAGYASDLLSCVMAKAKANVLWITLQTHPNIVAVASLLDLAGIIVTEGAEIDEATIEKARQEKIALYSSPLTAFSVVAKLALAGLPGVDM